MRRHFVSFLSRLERYNGGAYKAQEKGIAMATSMQELEAALRDDEELAKKYQEALKAAIENGATSDAEAIPAAAKAAGFEVTAEEVEKALAMNAELSEEDLEEVSGGLNFGKHTYLWEDEYGHDTFCLVSWHCLTAVLHTESENADCSCWSDWSCLFAYRHYNCTATDLHW